MPETTHLPQYGQYVLALTQEQRPRGLFVLRPHLAEGLGLLVQTCQRSHVELAVLARGDQRAAQALAHRAHVALLEHDDAVGVIRAQQHNSATTPWSPLFPIRWELRRHLLPVIWQLA